MRVLVEAGGWLVGRGAQLFLRTPPPASRTVHDMQPPLLLALVLAANDGSDETRWDMKLGFIPGTKDDVWTGHVTLEAGKLKCVEDARCTAITYRGRPDAAGQLFVYLKADTTVSESDKTWVSYVKVPAGLMDVSFSNPFDFPLELCWVDLTAAVAPVCYGSVAPMGEHNMSSFASHNFITKRLAWTASAAAVAADAADAADAPSEEARAVIVSKHMSGHEWETPAPMRAVAAAGGAVNAEASSADAASSTSVAAAAVTSAAAAASSEAPLLGSVPLRNALDSPVEICSGPRWATRLQYGTAAWSKGRLGGLRLTSAL